MCHGCVTFASVTRVHELLKWASKRQVAREITRRGYKVSGETLNRWVRENEEIPAIVQRLVLELYGLPDTTKEAEPPSWATRLMERVDAIHARQDTIMARQGQVASEATEALTKALAPLGRLADVEWLASELERAPQPSDEVPRETPDTGAADRGSPTGQASS